MPLMKHVDGKNVPMSEREEREFIESRVVAPPRVVQKSVIINRLEDAGLLNKAFFYMQSNPAMFLRWSSPDRLFVRIDDPDVLAMLDEIGVDPAVILA